MILKALVLLCSIIMACLLISSIVLMLSFSSTFSLATEAIPSESHATFKLKDLEVYIVLVSLPVGNNSGKFKDLESWYHSFLPIDTTTGLNDVSRIVYSYRNVVTGFAARLSPEEVKEMEQKEGCLSVRPQKILSLHTTHSPDFLGLQQRTGVWPNSNYGKGVIIGIVDTGITPGHPSFSDKDMPPPPAKWKGKCELKGTTCNNKLIGARNFVSYDTGEPIDNIGHGTHTASTAAGNFVHNANTMGQANGTAAGMAPHAHLAIYKVCPGDFCDESAIVAGMDAAVEDGVDVMSLSLGRSSTSFFDDIIAVGAFRAIQKGIFVSCSAGNSGPVNTSLENEAPWILTVGASTIDRNIRATVRLGNNEEFDGESIFQPKDFTPTLLPLVYGGMNGDQTAAVCLQGPTLNSSNVRGKVVLCDDEFPPLEMGQNVKDAGGAAMIYMNPERDGYTVEDEVNVLPATGVSFAAGAAIKAYINSTSSPTATISFKGTILGVKNAPAVASFSSRGPNSASPGILKPDIIGPGLNILAAWPDSKQTSRKSSSFYILSGTSMSCPHLSGVAALLKSAHPDWSPAAIKSAIMTTANITNTNGNPILDERMLPADIFTIGAGHVNPSRAIDPGLIYDSQPDDYIPYLCGLGYKDKEIQIIVARAVKCSKISRIPESQLNYPSFAVRLHKSTIQTYSRTVTNVFNGSSSYKVVIESTPGVVISVQPDMLKFNEMNQQMTYQITFRKTATSNNSSSVQGAITWVSKEHRVRSPISVVLLDKL